MANGLLRVTVRLVDGDDTAVDAFVESIALIVWLGELLFVSGSVDEREGSPVELIDELEYIVAADVLFERAS